MRPMVRPTVFALPRTSQAQAQCPTDFHQHDKKIINDLLEIVTLLDPFRTQDPLSTIYGHCSQPQLAVFDSSFVSKI